MGVTTSDNSFPLFSHGTVMISLSEDVKDKYQLHRDVLVRNSGWFAEQIVKIDDLPEQQVKKYFFKLASVENSVTLLLQSAALESSVINLTESESRAQITRAIKNNLTSSIQLHKDFFALIYSQPFLVDQSDLGSAFTQCRDIMHLASVYQSEHIIRPILCAQLVEFRHALFAAIAKDPVKWVNLAITLHSGIIYSEGLIHCIGGFPDYPWLTRLDKLSHLAYNTVCTKASQLTYLRMKVEVALLCNTLVDRKGNPVSLSTSRESWLVQSVFRDQLRYLIQRRPDGEENCEWCSSLVFLELFKRGNNIMNLDNLKGLLEDKLEGFDIYSWEHMSRDLQTLQDHAAREVQVLLKNCLTIDKDVINVPYFTCIDVKTSEYPWLNGTSS